MRIVLGDLPQIFKALGDPTRLKLIRLLMFNNEEKLKVIDLAEKLGISQPAITQHINILKELDLIKSHREKNRIFYYINKIKYTSYQKALNSILELSSMKCKFNGKCSECPDNLQSKKEQ
ncbi:MAG: ArsR family transcriptional regulator [Promethearchaeota archaeon]|nr:MAG: ArsR family transcriptional regulator [Candidatus Lokiarchaeota archaeon]